MAGAFTKDWAFAESRTQHQDGDLRALTAAAPVKPQLTLCTVTQKSFSVSLGFPAELSLYLCHSQVHYLGSRGSLAQRGPS